MALQNLIKRSIISVIALLLLSGCGRIVKEEVEIGWKGIAKIDRFLAASRFIEKMGIPSGSYPSAPQMPPENNTMLFIPASAMKSKGLFEQMDGWISNGGNVVFLLQVGEEGEYWVDKEDSPIQEFLEYEGIELKADYEVSNRELEDAKEGAETNKTRKDAMGSIYFGEGKQFKEEYATDYPNSFVFRFTPEEHGDDEGYYLYDSYDYGEGSVSILSTGLLFTNKYLDKAEHASLLWDLVKWYKPSEVQFIFSSNQSFWALLWKHASYAIIALVVLLTFWIWASAKRFGPIFQTVDASQNKLDEHVSATGHFFSKHGADSLIIDQIKADLHTSLARKVNLSLNAEWTDILAECQKHEVLTPEQIQLIQTPYPDKSKDQLVYLQTLKKLQS